MDSDKRPRNRTDPAKRFVDAASLINVYDLAVRRSDWFDALPREVRDKMLGRARTLTLAEGEKLGDRDEPPSGLCRVLDGCIRLSGTSQEGREAVLDFYGPGTWFADVATIDGLPRTHETRAYQGPARVLQLSISDMEELQAAYPVLTQALLRLLALRLRLLLLALESYSVQTMEQRLANRLLMLVTTFGQATSGGTRILLHLPQDVLAKLVGTTRQRVNQILKSWEQQGTVSQHYGELMLCDPRKLADLAER